MAKNSASSSIQMAALEKNANTRNNAAYTELRTVITASADKVSTVPNK
jgi:hypothetical protein